MLVGRSRELARIRECLAAARGGTASLLCLVGEPGLGKTTLLDQACDEARQAGMRVARLDCLESEAAIPSAGLGILLPLLGAPPEGGSTSVLLDAVAGAGDGDPVLLAIDDVQWLDEHSLRALSFCCRRLLADPVALIVTGRPQVLLLPEVAGLPTERLAPLTEDEGVALLRAAAPVIPATRAREIVTALSGVPLALEDVDRLLPADVLLGSAPLPSPVPVNEAVQARYAAGFEALPPRSRRAVVLLAAEDRGDAGLLVEALADDGLGLGDLTEAEAGGLVRCAPTPAFVHPLARSATHSAAAPAERRHAHAVLASVLARRGLPDRALRHRVEAATGPDQALSLALADAGTAAADAGGRRSDAATLFLLAARFAVVPTSRDGLLLEGARLSEPEDAARLARQLATDATEPEIRSSATLLIAERDLSLPPHDRIALLRGIPAESLTPAVARTRDMLLAWALMDAGDIDSLLDLTARVRTGLAADDWRMTATLGMALTYLGRAREALPLLTEAEERTRRIDPLTLPPAEVSDWAIIPGWLGDDAEHGRRFRLMDQALRATGQPEHAATAAFFLGERLRREGAWSACSAMYAESIDLASAVGAPTAIEHVRVACLHAEAGRSDETESALARAREQFETHPNPWQEHWVAYARGTLALSLGRHDDAVIHLSPLTRVPVPGRGARDAVATGLANLTEAHAGRGDRQAADGTAELLALILDGSIDPYGAALIARARAVAGRGDTADELQLALDHLARTTDAFDTARVHLLLGEHLRRDRRPKQAREWLSAAWEEFRRLDAPAWAARARRELEAAGQRPPSGTTSDVALTPQEMRVAMAVVDGMTNAEAASGLFLSVKTVEFHLGRVYRKLDVRSRGGLASALQRAGLL